MPTVQTAIIGVSGSILNLDRALPGTKQVTGISKDLLPEGEEGDVIEVEVKNGRAISARKTGKKTPCSTGSM